MFSIENIGLLICPIQLVCEFYSIAPSLMISGDYSFSIFTSIFLSTILEEDPDRDDVCDAVQLEVADVGGGLHAPDEEAGLHLVQPRPGAGRHPAPVQQLRGVSQLRSSENIHHIFSRIQGKKKIFFHM